MAGSHIFISVSHWLGLLSEDRVLMGEAGLSTEELMAGGYLQEAGAHPLCNGNLGGTAPRLISSLLCCSAHLSMDTWGAVLLGVQSVSSCGTRGSRLQG